MKVSIPGHSCCSTGLLLLVDRLLCEIVSVSEILKADDYKTYIIPDINKNIIGRDLS